MYTLHGFLTYGPLVDNARNALSKFGELSTDSLTYAKDKAWVTNSNSPQTTLVGFHSVSLDSDIQIPAGIAERLLQLGQWLYERAINGNVGTDPNNLRASLQSEFDTFAEGITLGPLESAGGIRLPHWIEYNDTQHESDAFVKVWLSNETFQAQYPNYVIEVLPPFDNIDDIFEGPTVIRENLAAISLSNRFDRVQEKRGEYPYTYVDVMDYEYINPVNEDDVIITPWTVLIYGEAGNNPDLIKEAISEWVLENSDRDREEWEDILPDLFLSTEFVVVPMWTQYSVPNLELEAGMYSPVIRPNQTLPLMQACIKGNGYTTGYIASDIEYSSIAYRSLAFGVVGNPNNRTEITSFYEQFDDYMLASTTSSDFNRISTRTQDFITMLIEMLDVAEDMTSTTTVPIGMSRIVRDGVTYLGKHYEDILYLVAIRESVESINQGL